MYMKQLMFIFLFINSLSSFSAPNSLTVGVIGGAPPFSEISYSSNGMYFFGFSIDIMNSICKNIKMTCTYKKVSFDAQFAPLDDGSIDLLLLANPYDPAQLHEYAISLPYVVSTVKFAALADSSIHEGTPIRNFKIGVIKRTYYNLLTKSSYDSNNTILPFNTVADMISALMAHKIDLILLNSSVVNTYIDNNLYNIKVVSREIQLGDGYGIVALPDKADLIKSINQAIVTMQTDGTYLSIFRKYDSQTTQQSQ
jgi:ABC-type amino acid transport substrate-binding protein